MQVIFFFTKFSFNITIFNISNKLLHNLKKGEALNVFPPLFINKFFIALIPEIITSKSVTCYISKKQIYPSSVMFDRKQQLCIHKSDIEP